MSWWCLGGVSVVSVVSWCFDGASMMSRWCLGGVSAASTLIQGVHGVLVVSWWRRVGGVGAVVLVVLGCVSVVFPCASLRS